MTLDEAWAAAEGALPVTELDADGLNAWGGLSVYRYEFPPEHIAERGRYGAKVSPPGDTGADAIYGYGFTPAEALQALTAIVRERLL